MSLSDAFVRVECDGAGCRESDEIPLTALAGRGQYDMRNVQKQIDKYWVTEGGRHYCESCQAEREAEREAMS